MDRYVINADGDLLSGDLRTLQELLEANLPESFLRDHAVNVKGFVVIDHDGHRTNIYLPARLHDLAVVNLYHWLQGSSTKSIILYDYMPNGRRASLRSRQAVIEWLQTLLPSHRPCKNTFRSRPISPNRSVLAPLVRAFLDVTAQYRSVDAVEAICNEMFRGRYTICSFAGDASTMLIRSLGHGYNSFNQAWTSMARGCRPQDGPDYHYGLWIGETHCRALLTNRLLFDDVDAVIGRPLRSPTRETYTRCVVPFRLRKGPCYVLSASAARDDINLRS